MANPVRPFSVAIGLMAPISLFSASGAQCKSAEMLPCHKTSANLKPIGRQFEQIPSRTPPRCRGAESRIAHPIALAAKIQLPRGKYNARFRSPPFNSGKPDCRASGCSDRAIDGGGRHR